MIFQSWIKIPVMNITLTKLIMQVLFITGTWHECLPTVVIYIMIDRNLCQVHVLSIFSHDFFFHYTGELTTYLSRGGNSCKTGIAFAVTTKKNPHVYNWTLPFFVYAIWLIGPFVKIIVSWINPTDFNKALECYVWAHLITI